MEETRARQLVELEIGDLAAGGRGLARAGDGRVVFVAGALAGEKVLTRINRERRDYLEAEAVEILAASPQRVQPPCPLYGRCGGCDFMHLGYPEQVRAKTAWVSRALRKLPGLPQPVIMPSPAAWGWRNRLRFQVDAGRLGFFARASHDLVQVERCPVAAPAVNLLLPGLAVLLAEPGGKAVAWVEVLAEGEEAYLTLGAGEGLDEAWLASLEALPGVLGVSGGKAQARPYGLVYYQRPGLVLRAYPGQFSQVNFAANRLLIEAVLTLAGPGQGHSALDLYAGSGNFSLPLAAAGWRVLAVEGEHRAVRAARRLIKANALGEAVETTQGEAGQALAELARAGQGFNLVVLDPPRTGAKGLMEGLLKLEPERVVYVSCHPAALARDAAELAEAGYRPLGLTVVDMFPHTGHVEAVLGLQRRQPGA